MDLQQIRNAGALGHDVRGDAGGPILTVRLGGGAHDGELRQRLLGVAREGAREQALAGEFPPQQCNPRGLRHRAIVALHARHPQQLRHHPLVHVGVLAQVECREMEPEYLHRADQPRKRAAAARLDAAELAFVFERALEHQQIFAQFVGVRIRFGLHRSRARRRAVGNSLVSGRYAGVDARDGPPVGLIGAGGIPVAAAHRQLMNGIRYRSELDGNGELLAHRVQLVQIIGQQRLGGPAQRPMQRVRRDMRIAVSIAADPAPHPQETRKPLTQQSLPSGIQRRQYREEHVPKVGERHVDFIRDVQPFAPQGPRLPGERDLRRDAFLDQLTLGGLDRSCVALAHERRDAIAVVQHALAHHLGRMGRQHRNDQGVRQERRCVVWGNPL